MKIILTVIFTFYFYWAFAEEKKPLPSRFESYKLENILGECDACGCSATGGSMGFNSLVSENFIGLRYLYQNYKSRDGVFNNSPWIDENFSTVQLWGRIPIGKKIEITALVPYQFLNRKKESGSQNLSGIGDINLLAFYNLYQTQNDSLALQHKILVGAGVKIPTGKFDNENNGSINPSFQLGTGSWDYSLATEYIVTRKNIGFNANLSYIFKTENNQNYQFGDQFNYGGGFFYTTNIKELIVVPQLGVSGENYQYNKDHREKVPLTKGDIFFGRIGLETAFKKFSAGMNVMLPINQNLNGNRVEANYRLAFNLNYIL
ncbi:transporter family protein [Flavobacterium ichthyis]|nr:transporter [Flavobacterium ichthyis]